MTHALIDHSRESVGETTLPRVLALTNEWPTEDTPRTTVFIKRQVEFLRMAGVTVEPFFFEGAQRPWRYLTGWIRVRRRLARERFDLVHAQFGQTALLALPKRVPLVVTFRGDDLMGIIGRNGRPTLAGRLLRKLSGFVARRADAVVLVSEHMRQFLPRAVRKSAAVIPSGLDLRYVRPHPQTEARAQLGLPTDRRLVLFAANPAHPRKRFALAQRAVELLKPDLPVDLVLAWGVRHERMPLYMSACDVLVLTSLHEGSPNVVKEALACDLPVVSVAVGDVPDRLRHVDGCEVCTDGRPETIAAALRRVLERGRRIHGRQAVAHLDEALLAQRVIDIYRQAMSAGRPAATVT